METSHHFGFISRRYAYPLLILAVMICFIGGASAYGRSIHHHSTLHGSGSTVKHGNVIIIDNIDLD